MQSPHKIFKLVLRTSDIGVLYTLTNRLKRIKKSEEMEKTLFFQLNKLNIAGCKHIKPENYMRIFYDRGDFALMKKFISELPVHRREKLIFYSLACDRQYLSRMVQCYKEIGNIFKKN